MDFSRQEHWSGLPCPSPGEYSWPRDQTRISCIGKWILCCWATRDATLSLRRENHAGDFTFLRKSPQRWEAAVFHIHVQRAPDSPPSPGLPSCRCRWNSRRLQQDPSCLLCVSSMKRLLGSSSTGLMRVLNSMFSQVVTPQQHWLYCSWIENTFADLIYLLTYLLIYLQSFLCYPTLPATSNGFSTFTALREVRKCRPLLWREWAQWRGGRLLRPCACFVVLLFNWSVSTFL